MKRLLLLIIALGSADVSTAQISSALSPQIGPAIVNGRVFLIGGGDYSIGGDYFRLGLGAMFSLTKPKVNIMGSGPYRHTIAYYGVSAEYAFDPSEVVDFITGDHEVRAVVMAGIGGSELEYVGTVSPVGTPNVYANTGYYILQPGLFYTIGDFDAPMQVGLSLRYILSTIPPEMKPRYFTGVNVTYRVTIDYNSVWF